MDITPDYLGERATGHLALAMNTMLGIPSLADDSYTRAFYSAMDQIDRANDALSGTPDYVAAYNAIRGTHIFVRRMMEATRNEEVHRSGPFITSLVSRAVEDLFLARISQG